MPVRELREELKAKAKAELNEDPARTEDDLRHIKEWLKKQQHINARTDDQFLISFLRGAKFSLDRTKEKIDHFYTMKTMLPEFFRNRDPHRPDIQDVIKKGICLVLWDEEDPLAPTLIIVRISAFAPSQLTDVIKFCTMVVETGILVDDNTFVNGVRMIFDWTDSTLAHLPSPTVLKKLLTVHTVDNIDSFYKIVPKRSLPKEYGGEGKSFAEIVEYGFWVMNEHRNWFIEDEKHGTDEQKRPGKPKTVEELFGIEGSFRQLVID